MEFIKTLLSIPGRKKTTDYDKIQVTSNGAFYMKSEDLFDDKEKSLELIQNLRNAVEKYKEVQIKVEK